MKTIKSIFAVAVVAAVFAMALVASAAQPVIYTLNLASANLVGTTYVTNPVWTTQSGGQLTNLDVGLQSQLTLYAVVQGGPTNGVVNAGTNGAFTISGLISPDNGYFTASNAPASFTVGIISNALTVAMPYSNLPATSWRYWGGVLTITANTTNYSAGPAFTNSVLQLKSFWKAP